MILRWFLPLLWALPAEADFFQFDSISNVSTYYFNYIYCNLWEGECQPHQDDATMQGRRRGVTAALEGVCATKATSPHTHNASSIYRSFVACPDVHVTAR